MYDTKLDDLFILSLINDSTDEKLDFSKLNPDLKEIPELNMEEKVVDISTEIPNLPDLSKKDGTKKDKLYSL